MKITFLPSRASGNKRQVYSRGNSKEIMIGFDIDETIKELFDSLFFQSYQESLEKTMKGSDYVFDFADDYTTRLIT